jgi:hypothetical protein
MTKRKILQDHKRRGKALIPPFTDKLGPLREVSWVRTMLPEFLWIALIQDCHGLHEGVDMVTALTRIARRRSPSEKKHIIATITSLGELNTDEQSFLRSELAASGDLFNIQKPLLPLVVFYPDCPLRFLYSTEPTFADGTDQHLERFKTQVQGLYDKTSRDTMMVQATAMWLAFDSGVLKVSEGLALASFPEIEEYPYTEL